MLTISSLSNLYVFFIKYIYEADIKLTAVETDLFLLIYAVQIQIKVLMQAVYILFIHIMHGANMYRITLLCQTDQISLRVLRKRIIL